MNYNQIIYKIDDEINNEEELLVSEDDKDASVNNIEVG